MKPRAPVTDEQLDQIPLDPAESDKMRARVLRLSMRIDALGLSEDLLTGVSLIRAGCIYASLLGLPPEDLWRFVRMGVQMAPRRDVSRVLEMTEERLQKHTLRVLLVSREVLAEDGADDFDALAVQLIVGAMQLRFGGLAEAQIAALFGFVIGSADKLVVAHALRSKVEA